MPPKTSGRGKKAAPRSGTSAPKTADLLNLIAQQQTVLTSIAQQLVSNPVTPATPAAPPRPVKTLPLPKLISPDAVNITQFRDWKQRWSDYEVAHQLTLHPLVTQQGILRSALDTEWTILWRSGRLQIQETSTLKEINDLLEAYIRKRRNPLLDRQAFHHRDQMEGETVERYYAALKSLDDSCAHEDTFTCDDCLLPCETLCNTCLKTIDTRGILQELRIRDRLVCGLRSQEMQKKVLAEQYNNSLSLDKVLALCIAIETSERTGDTLRQDDKLIEANSASSAKSTYKKQQQSKSSESNPTTEKCWFCGKSRHPRSKCPAQNELCNKCKVKGHFAVVCRKSAETGSLSQVAPPNPIPSSSALQTTHIQAVNSIATHLPLTVTIDSQDYSMKWRPDTGADVDAIGKNHLEEMGVHALNAIQPEKVEVVNASGVSLGPVGSIPCKITLNGRVCQTTLRVFQYVTTPLLSLASCKQLGLLDANWPYSRLLNSHINAVSSGNTIFILPSDACQTQVEAIKLELMKEVPATFDDTILREMHGPPMIIELVDGAVPFKRYKAHSIPFHWRDAVKAQLDSMLAKGVIEPVPIGEAVDWCHPMVVVPKKGTNEPRITVDLTRLNPYVRRPAYPVKVPREAVARIPPGNKFFTTLDARHGYWQVPLDEASKKLCTFITPWGCFRYRRNVMGLISAGDEHNRRGDEALAGIENVEKIVEDILIYDKDFDSHVARVREVLQRCNTHGITLNAKKFQFALPEVDWCGYHISAYGYTPAAHLTSALTHFPVPTSKTDVRSFNGLVQQFEAFSSRISELAIPLRSILSPKVDFSWGPEQQTAFENIINELRSPRILAHFHPGRPVRLETDAAQSKGLGYALWQQQEDGVWKLLQAGSRFVTPAESRYSATEIELLAVTWAVRKCRLYLLGYPFELIVDHRPLIPIINSKTLDEVENPRLQRLKQKLASFRLQASWRAGTKHTVVDVFSRYPTADPDDEDLADEDSPIFHAFALEDEEGNSVIHDSILSSVKELTAQNFECQRLKKYIVEGFPDDKDKLDHDLHPYWQFRANLTQEAGLIFCGSRVLIPKPLRHSIINILHSSHQGQVRTLRRARQAVFWPGLTNDIQNVVSRCEECASRLPSQQKEPCYVGVTPTRPFQIVCLDLFSFAGNEYLVMTDRYSGWFQVARCGRSAAANHVIHFLKRWLTDVGIPEIMESDNGPQFASSEFQNWVRKWGIKHETSSPHYPQSNGAAEAGVKIAKYLLSKTSPNGDLDTEAFQQGLLELRNTPRADGRSPAQLIYGTPIRTLLPMHFGRFSQEWKVKARAADYKAIQLKEKARSRYNADANPLTPFKVGEIVRIQDYKTKRWDLLGEVIDHHHRGRSYIIRTESGRVLRRNRRALRRFHPRSSDTPTPVPVLPEPEGPRRSTRQRKPVTHYGCHVPVDPGSPVEEGHVVSSCSQSTPTLPA